VSVSLLEFASLTVDTSFPPSNLLRNFSQVWVSECSCVALSQTQLAICLTFHSKAGYFPLLVTLFLIIHQPTQLSTHYIEIYIHSFAPQAKH
jgi:hypothetical protein